MKTSKHYNVRMIIALILYLMLTFSLYGLYRDHSSAAIIFDGVQGVASLVAGVFIMSKGLRKSPFNHLVYTGYACLLWSLGQIFWFAYIAVGRKGLPFPSVAELAFLGAFFFLAAAMKVRGHFDQKRARYPAWLVSGSMFTITIIAVIVTNHLNTFMGIYSIAYMLIAAWVLFLSLAMSELPFWLRSSVSLLCLADWLLIIQMLGRTEPILFISDPIYPLVFMLLMQGVWKDRSKIG